MDLSHGKTFGAKIKLSQKQTLHYRVGIGNNDRNATGTFSPS
ncbi:MAG TPA: hypothetical protein VE954_23130 [Oligoflexus sp.]|nr:hypothetical protein [Oligoflexus sp.]HYX36005.1 hypothetical protein [Oligoflexus sp.]